MSESLIGMRRNLSNAMSSWPCPWNARPNIRFDSADSASDLALPASVSRYCLVVSIRCPTTSNTAGSISLSQVLDCVSDR